MLMAGALYLSLDFGFWSLDCVPKTARNTFGRVLFSRVPRPKPIFSATRFSIAPKPSTNSASSAAPVGVTSSCGSLHCVTPMPRAPRIASVAGAGNGKTSVRTINPARAFDHRRGKHAWFAELFQRDGRTDNVHDGIHRADFVKVDFVRRQAVNSPFRFGNALKHGDGFLFHPCRKFAA